MKNYVSPKMELVVVSITDVITASNDVVVMEKDNEFPASFLFS